MLYAISRGAVEGYAEGQQPVIYLRSTVEAWREAGLGWVFTEGHADMLRRMDNGRMQRVLIEFEFESKNFLDHMHDPKGCDPGCLLEAWMN